MKNKLFELVELLESSMLADVKHTELGKTYIDPIDGVEISAHYAQSHAAAGMILRGIAAQNTGLYENGIALLDKLLATHEHDIKLPAYHFDFNNFALCLIYDALKDKDTERAEEIKTTVLKTADSNHDTINWLPMRMFALIHRYVWTGEKKYKDLFDSLVGKIKEVTYSDGLIDDRYPKGISYNLQYNISTVAVLLLMKNNGMLSDEFDFNKLIGAIIGAAAPDGDINYLGRGCNQIFAWGPWMYILKNTSYEANTDHLFKNAAAAVKNKNILLNDRAGEDKYFWWDYHYSSVYTAHLYLWLILTDLCKGLSITPEAISYTDGGMHIYKSQTGFVSVFDGRSEYLAEMGPAVAAIWSKNCGMIFKGSFGPLGGAFGNIYSIPETVLQNYLGLTVIRTKHYSGNNRYIKKLMSYVKQRPFSEVSPEFAEITADVSSGIKIIWQLKEKKECVLNIPVFEDCGLEKKNIRVSCDGKPVGFVETGKIYNQYGWCRIYKTNITKGENWCLEIV